jgi:catechol 2,3-dioxygenase-like lactoylglutathione lyase family enzyme
VRGLRNRQPSGPVADQGITRVRRCADRTSLSSSAPHDAEPTDQGACHGHKLEVIVIPVSDVDRSVGFYKTPGWRLDADFAGVDVRVVQVTPPGSPASVIFGTNITTAEPGSADGMMLIVSDIAARADFIEHGVDVSEVFHDADGIFHHGGTNKRLPGPGKHNASYRSYPSFADPDGNTWYLQEVTTRLPGRVDPTETTFASTDDLAAALRRAAKAHGEHEARIGAAVANWPDWYADYMVREQAGTELPS